MGYESKLYVIEKGVHTDLDGRLFGMSVAMFDLCKVTNVARAVHDSGTDTNCYFFVGDKKIIEDEYGEPLKELSIPEMITILEKAAEEESDYRRYAPCISLLKGFDLERWPNTVVLHYGH